MHNPKSEILGCDKLPHLTGISSQDSERLGRKIKKIFTPPHFLDLGVAQDSKEDKGQRCFVEDATPLNKSFVHLQNYFLGLLQDTGMETTHKQHNNQDLHTLQH